MGFLKNNPLLRLLLLFL